MSLRRITNSSQQGIVEEQRAVVVHCSFIPDEDCRIQLAQDAVLHDHGSQHKSRLLYMEGLGIPAIPQLMIKDRTVRFTLYFEPLPADCTMFNLSMALEDGQSLVAVDVPRLRKDVYNVELELAPF